ncbi:MAG: flagellar basal body rod protein FlgB [bacterium]
MIDAIFSGETIKILEKALNASALQQQMLSNNIANVDTPGYKTSEVVFQNKLKDIINKTADKDFLELKVTDKRHISLAGDVSIDTIQPQIITRTETSMRTDENNVDIDMEMAKLSENTVYYSTLAQLTSMKLSGLKNVIKEGR